MAEHRDAPSDDLTVVSALAERTRRAVYEFVSASDGWVGRDQVAEGVSVERATAAHHLDRLEDAGLLEIDFRRLSNKTGPGAGRPAKLYRRSARQVDVSLPPRDYELAAQLLAGAIQTAQDSETREDPASAVERTARAEGERIAGVMQTRLADVRRHDSGERLAVALEVLADHGYEPRRTDADTVVLRNCPFHNLAQRHTQLVCTMNLQLLDSAVERFGGTGFCACFEPSADQCCVKLRRDVPEMVD
ncbi:helix-turn-helix transcriptional regulator [Antricoccus suffuscus]|nr:helix-turn-helix domain-containing protein [Antricoccus suffuscus]